MLGVKYLAGWGYILSRDVFTHALAKIDRWHTYKDQAPFWYKLLAWEDVMMGMLIQDKINQPIEVIGFKAAWRACTNQTAVSHYQNSNGYSTFLRHDDKIVVSQAQPEVFCMISTQALS